MFGLNSCGESDWEFKTEVYNTIQFCDDRNDELSIIDKVVHVWCALTNQCPSVANIPED